MSSHASAAAFDKSKRLLTAADYSRVFDQPDARASHKYLLLLARRSDHPHHRLGLVIAKKNVRLAVQRNRIKRLAREMFRHQARDNISIDVVLLVRRGVAELDNDSLSTILQQQWKKLLRQAENVTPAHPDQDS